MTTWSVLVEHSETARLSWAGLRPRLEVRSPRGVVVYRPKVSGHVSIGPFRSLGRVYTFGRGP
jgi:hypothetical protein